MGMTDLEIIECVEKKNELVINTVKSLFDSHTSSIATLITTENQGLKEHIQRLEAQVIKQNGSVRSLREWKASLEGAEKERETIKKRSLSTAQIVGIVIAAVVGLTTATLSIVNAVGHQKEKLANEKIENWMRMWDFSPITRGGQPILDTTKFQIKQDAKE